MSTYDGSPIKVGNNLDANRLVSELTNELPCSYSGVTDSGIISTSSTSYVDISGASGSIAVEADEIVLFRSNLSLSAGTLNHKIAVRHTHGGIDAGRYSQYTAAVASTSGEVASLALETVLQDTAGTITFAVQWANATAAATIYCFRRAITITKFKRRS